MKNLLITFSAGILCFVITAGSRAQNVPEWTHDINVLPDSAYVFPVRTLNDDANYVFVLSTYSKPIGPGISETKIYLNKYSESGVLQWGLVYDNSGNGQPRGYDMAVDTAGNCYIAGGFTDPLNKPLLLKVNASGNVVWQQESTISFNSSWFDQVIFQNNRLFLKAADGIATFDTDGNEIWSLGNMEATRLAVDLSGQMIVSAIQPGTSHTVFRYDAAGILNFSDSTIVAKRITTDGDNNILLLTDFPQYELVKYDSNGNFAWNKSDFPLTPGFGDIGFEVVTDYDHSVILAGLADTMFKFTPDGELVWKQPMNGLDNYLITAKIAYDNFLAVAGTILGANGYDMKVALFNLNGVESWSGYFNSNDIQEFPVDMTIDNSGVYVIEDNISNTTLVKFSSPFLSEIDYDLVCVDSVWYDGADPGLVNVRIFNGNVSHLNYPSVQIVSPGGDTISNAINFVNFFAQLGNTYQVYTDTITVAGIPDFTDYTFLMNEFFGDSTAVIDWCFATVIGEISGSEVLLYPNPVKDFLFIQHNGTFKKNSIITIYDLMGTRVLEETLPEKCSCTVDVSSLAGGLYVLRITDGNSLWQQKFVKE